MLTYVLEASSLLRYIDAEQGAAREAELLDAQEKGSVQLLISAVNWGEVIYILPKRQDIDRAAGLEAEFNTRLRIVSVTPEVAAQTAAARLSYGIPYADSFAIQLTRHTPCATLVTADFDFVPAMQDVHIEFLPKKP